MATKKTADTATTSEPADTITTGADPATELSRIRAEIERTRCEIKAIDGAPLPLDEAVASLRASLDAASDLYWSRATGILGSFARSRRASALSLLPGPGDPDLPTVLLALGGDALRAAFEGRLRAVYAADPMLEAAAVPAADRPPRASALREELRRLELAEELCIVHANRHGMAMQRRADVENIDALFHDEVLRAEGLLAA